MIRPFWLLALALPGVVALNDLVFAQARTGGATLKSQSVPNSRAGGDRDSVGYFQMRVGGSANQPKKPKTNTLCAPVGGKRPARC